MHKRPRTVKRRDLGKEKKMKCHIRWKRTGTHPGLSKGCSEDAPFDVRITDVQHNVAQEPTGKGVREVALPPNIVWQE